MNIKDRAQEAKNAAIQLMEVSTNRKNKALAAIAKGLRENRKKIIAANEADLRKAEK